MRSYSINKALPTYENPLFIFDTYTSLDGTFMSGYTLTSSNLVDGEYVQVKLSQGYDSSRVMTLPIHIETVQRQGYIEYLKETPLYKTLLNNSTNQYRYYFLDIDGKYKGCISNEENFSINRDTNGKNTVSATTASTTIQITVKSYIEDNKVLINGIENVASKDDKGCVPYIIDQDGNFHECKESTYEEWYDVVKFTITSNTKTDLVFDKPIDLVDIDPNIGLGSTVIQMYVDSENSLMPTEMQYITAVSNYRINERVLFEEIGNDIYKGYYCGTVYYFKKNDDNKIWFINKNNKEYQFFIDYKNDESKNYIGHIFLPNGSSEYLEIVDGNEKKAQSLDNQNLTYEANYYYLMQLDNERGVKIHEDTSDSSNIVYYADVFQQKKYYLTVLNQIGANIIQCSVLTDSVDVIDDAHIELVSNYNDYTFGLEGELLTDTNYTQKILANQLVESEYLDQLANQIPSYEVIKISQFMDLPITLERDNAYNLYQEWVVNNDFVNDKTREMLNTFVDMEKDIYYPMYLDNNQLKEVHELKFYLHFRTRDENWNVIDDYGSTASWNLIDYYKDNTTNIKDDSYYQPSDLLYFLNYTNNDVYYRKSKIKRSFLRISFYDTPNKNTQSLLCTSVIYLDGNLLYSKYVNSTSDEKNKYMPFYENNQNKIKGMLSVDAEPLDDNNKFSFDENERLDMTMTVGNKLASNQSSEGFYLYIFKEYLNQFDLNEFHDREIYMKLQFNHAGMGRTLDMYQPRNEQGKRMSWNDITTNTDGIELSKVLDSLYIPIKLRYDEKNKKFCYYLPSDLSDTSDPSVMKFNLYELKIKDESE